MGVGYDPQGGSEQRNPRSGTSVPRTVARSSLGPYGQAGLPGDLVGDGGELMPSIKDMVVISAGVLLAGLMVFAVWTLHSSTGDESPFVDVVTVQPANPYVIPLQPYRPPTPTPGGATLPSGA